VGGPAIFCAGRAAGPRAAANFLLADSSLFLPIADAPTHARTHAHLNPAHTPSIRPSVTQVLKLQAAKEAKEVKK